MPRSPRLRPKPKAHTDKTPKLTPEVQAQIVESIRMGSWFATAAEAAGVYRETAKSWRRIGQGWKRNATTRKWERMADVGPEPYASFEAAVRAALGHADQRDQQHMAKAAIEDWRAAAYRQERRNPKVFGERIKLEVETKVQKSMDAFMRDLEAGVSPAAYAEVVSFVSKTMGLQPGGGS